MTIRYRLAALFKWERQDGDVLLCDGGTVTWGSDAYRSRHAVVGHIAEAEQLDEGVGDDMPSGRISFAPAAAASSATLSNAALQGTRIRAWVAELDPDSGEVTGTPDLQLDALVQVTWIRHGKGVRFLDVDFSARAQTLFLANEGNVLSGEAHRRVWPGERGLDNAVGVSRAVAWGTSAPTRGTASYGGGSGGAGGLRKEMV